jgi:hypothetical protein
MPLDSVAYAGLRWRELGPFRGGRSVAVAGNPQRPNEFWMGTTGGGVYKSINAGESWAAVTDKYFGGTIGAIAVAPSSPDVVYVGGGEYPIRGNVAHGDGVWKTTDGGKTWAYMGLRETPRRIPILSTSEHWATSGRLTLSAGSFVPKMAARRGIRSYFEMTRPASLIL